MTSCPPPPPRPFVVTVDGNIGCGKTTVLSLLKSAHRQAVVVEPIDVWQPFLDRLYAGEPGAALAMQVRVWFDRAARRPGADTDAAIVFVERSPRLQVAAFVDAQSANFAPNEANLLSDLYREAWEPDLFVYLRSSPDACARRIAKRARASEDAVRVDYLAVLHDRHEGAFADGGGGNKQKVVVIDVERKSPEEIAQTIVDAAAAAAAAAK